MAEYWFKPKRYGYGATPVTWQGWAVTRMALALGRPIGVVLRRINPELI
jgi:hypothetical protein